MYAPADTRAQNMLNLKGILTLYLYKCHGNHNDNSLQNIKHTLSVISPSLQTGTHSPRWWRRHRQTAGYTHSQRQTPVATWWEDHWTVQHKHGMLNRYKEVIILRVVCGHTHTHTNYSVGLYNSLTCEICSLQFNILIWTFCGIQYTQ